MSAEAEAEAEAEMKVELVSQKARVVLQTFVGLLLIAAALLKSYQATKTTPDMEMSRRLFELGLIEFELLVGGMLLLNIKPKIAWALALAGFTIFTGVSIRNVIAKAPACGCFGPARVDPRIMAGVDALIVISLIMTGPRRPRFVPPQKLWRAVAVFVVAMMCLAVGIQIYAAVPKRGLVAEPGTHDFAQMKAAQASQCDYTFIVRNTSTSPIRITSSTSSCGCTVAQVPSDPINAGATAEVKLRANWSHAAGNISSQVTLHTDNRWTPVVNLVIYGYVIPAD